MMMMMMIKKHVLITQHNERNGAVATTHEYLKLIKEADRDKILNTERFYRDINQRVCDSESNFSSFKNATTSTDTTRGEEFYRFEGSLLPTTKNKIKREW
jgi:hypothetical protein